MATGTSSELPAVMLDKLGEFLAEDPYGNMEKVDKFCTYLENNGPAALHVADGRMSTSTGFSSRSSFPIPESCRLTERKYVN